MAKTLQDYLDEIDEKENPKPKKPIKYGWNKGKKYQKHRTVVRTKKFGVCWVSFDNPAPHLGRGWYICLQRARTSFIYTNNRIYIGVDNKKAPDGITCWWESKEDAVKFLEGK